MITSIMVVLLISGAFRALAENQTSGLAKGDVFYYEMYAEYSSSNPDVVIQVPPFEANNTSWVRIEITDVSNSIISQVYTIRYLNGNEIRVKGQTDLTDPSGYSNNFRGVPICKANLNVGDDILGGQLVVNDTQTRIFLGSTRQLIHTSWSSPIDYGECYFDRQTGILTELFHVHLYINPETNESINKTDIVKMTNSSLW